MARRVSFFLLLLRFPYHKRAMLTTMEDHPDPAKAILQIQEILERGYEMGALLEYYGLTLSIFPHDWNIVRENVEHVDDEEVAIVTKPPSPNKPLFLESKNRKTSSFILRLGYWANTPNDCSSVTVVFKAGAYGQAQWIVNEKLINTQHRAPSQLPSFVKDITRSEQDQCIKMQFFSAEKRACTSTRCNLTMKPRPTLSI